MNMSPMNLMSDATGMLKGKLQGILGDTGMDNLEKGAGMASDFLTGKTEANSLFSFLGQGAGRALSYTIMLKGANAAVSKLGDGMGVDLDFGSLIPLVTVALTAYTGYKQYNENKLAISGDSQNKWASISEKAKVLMSDEGSLSEKMNKVLEAPKVDTPVMDIPRAPKMVR